MHSNESDRGAADDQFDFDMLMQRTVAANECPPRMARPLHVSSVPPTSALSRAISSSSRNPALNPPISSQDTQQTAASPAHIFPQAQTASIEEELSHLFSTSLDLNDSKSKRTFSFANLSIGSLAGLKKMRQGSLRDLLLANTPEKEGREKKLSSVVSKEMAASSISSFTGLLDDIAKSAENEDPTRTNTVSAADLLQQLDEWAVLDDRRDSNTFSPEAQAKRIESMVGNLTTDELVALKALLNQIDFPGDRLNAQIERLNSRQADSTQFVSLQNIIPSLPHPIAPLNRPESHFSQFMNQALTNIIPPADMYPFTHVDPVLFSPASIHQKHPIPRLYKSTSHDSQKSTNEPCDYEKPFKCPFSGCRKSYKNPNGLKYHLEHTHVPTENQVLYPCPICEQKKYKDCNGLKYHLVHAHQIEDPFKILDQVREMVKIER